MSISKKLAETFKELTPEAKKKLIRMAWSDKTSMKEIEKSFGFSANQVEKFMRFELSEKDYKRWHKRRMTKFNQKSRKAAKLRSILRSSLD